MKKNDYIIASINNPDFTAEDFRNVAGYSLKDTLMLKEEDYLSNDFIKSNPLFLDSTGTFRKELFSEFYKDKLKDFNNFSNEDFADSYEYSAFDTRRKGKDKIAPFGITFFNNPNPTMLNIGIEGPNEVGLRILSDREIALKQKIFDTKSGKFLDYSPNDLSLIHNPLKWIKSLVLDPLVLAIYDEAGEHIDPITRRKVKHNKGDKKLNSDGLPYYERLNGRSIIGRDILSSTDILTIDGDIINKYDFLDSDDLDKSIAGTISKTVAAVLPLFSTTIAPYYGTFLMLRELAKTAPMLYGMGTALFSDDPDSYIPNTVAAYAQKLTTSTSDYSKEKTFTFENFGNLIADVALQWEQQLAVIRAFNKLNNATNKRIQVAKMKALNEYEKETTALINESKLGKISTARVQELTGASNTKQLKELIANNKWENTYYGRVALDRNIRAIEEYINRRTKLGQDLSLGYMALISNTDVYQSALEHGADKKEAAALALGSTAGMFAVDKWLGLGEMFFLVPAEREVFRSSIRNEAKTAIETLLGKSKSGSDIKGFFKAGMRTGKKVVNDFRDAAKARELPLLGKAIGEGLEEVSEELVTDLIKSAGELAADFGWISGPNDLGAWDNMGDRYLMSLLGGTIGGGIFGVKLKIAGNENLAGPKLLLLLIRQGKTNELRKELNTMYKNGQLGRTDLSIEYLLDSDGNKVFLTPDDKHISQNEYVYNLMSLAIDQILNIIEAERLNKTEDDLFKLLVLKDERYMRLEDYLKGKSYLVGYQQRYLDLVQAIVQKSQEIANLKKSDGDNNKNDLAILRATEELKTKELERDRFLSGELSLEYLKKLNFIMNPILTKGFVPLTEDLFAIAVTGAHFDSLDYNAKLNVLSAYKKYISSKENIKEDINKAFEDFQDLTAKLGLPLMNFLETYKPSYEFWDLEVEKLEKFKLEAAWSWDDLLEGETPEEYEYRNKPMEDEDETLYTARSLGRAAKILEHNENIFNYLKLALDNFTYIDATTKRRFNILLEESEGQIKRNLISQYVKDPEIGTEILNGTNPEEVLPKLRKQKEDEFRAAIWLSLKGELFSINSFMGYDAEGKPVFLEFPVLFSRPGEDLAEEQTLMQEAQERLMNKLGINNFNTGTLYNALGNDPVNKFYEIYNGILEELSNEGKAPMTGAVGMINHPIAIMLAKYGEGLAAIDPSLSEDERKAAISDLEKLYTLQDIRLTAIDTLVSQELDLWENSSSSDPSNPSIKAQASAITRALENDKTLLLLNQLKERTVLKSPGDELLNMISKYLGDEEMDIIKMLENLGTRWDGLLEEGDFEITPDEKKRLIKAKEIIEMAKSIIAGMYGESYLGNNISYNKSINEFVRAHKEVQENWEDLPVIDRQSGLSIYHSLDMFEEEIDEWIDTANNITDNKIKSIKESKDSYDAALQDLLFTTCKDHWLLEGYDGSSNIGAQVTLYNNVQKALKAGKTTNDILDEFINIIGKDDAILSQRTSDIRPGLSSSTFTAYDRFLHLVMWASVNKAEYLKAEREFFKNNPSIAYLPTLEPAMLYAYALKNNKDFVYAAIDKLTLLAASKGLNIPPIYGITCTGIGGAGKTKAVAAFSYDENESTWISGPTDSLIKNLKEIAPKAESKLRKDLIKYITGGNTDLLKNYSEGIGLDNSKTLILPDISDKLVTTNAPKHLIIDEVTWYSNLELQAISQWAKKAGVRLTLLGDENQKGNVIIKNNGSVISNITREISMTVRTPRLAVSLRTANLWKTRNQADLVNLMNRLRNADDSVSTEDARLEVLNALKHTYHINYWEDDNDIKGDKIVTSLEAKDILRLLDKEVVYVGTNPEPLRSKFKNLKTFSSLQDIQGSEFPYVIIDNTIDFTNTDSAVSLLNGLRDLYTAISRSKEATIIIDSKLGHSINGKKQDYTTLSINLSEDAISLLNNVRDLEIEQELANIPKTEEKAEKKSVKPKKSKVNVSELIKNQENPEEEFNGEFRAYSNINFLGGVKRETIEGKFSEIFGPYKLTNWIASGERKDIGIFGTEGYLAKTPTEKASLVYDLACLRSIFTFDKFDNEGDGDFLSVADFNGLSKRVLDILGGDPSCFRNVKYYAVAEDYNPDTHSLIGETTAENDKVSFMSNNGVDLVITILARIPIKDNTLVITLGAVANPDTWEKAIKKRTSPTNPTELKIFEELLKKDLDAVKQYRQELKDLVEHDRELEIDKPRFTGQTEIILLDDKIPLGDMYDGISEWEKRTANFTVSPVYVIVDDLKNINPELSSNLTGRPVVFVSSDPSLSPESLRDLWKQLLLDRENNTARVRMLALDNKGISFNSLYKHTFRKLYTTNFTGDEGEDSSYEIPFELEPEAIRIFYNTWNFRANLINFNAKVRTLLEKLNWSLEELEEKVRRYNELYNIAKKELKNDESDKKSLSDSEFYKWLTLHPDMEGVADTIIIRDFNLKDLSKTREFRLGYSKDGAYIGKLYGVDKNLYNGDANGVYISPILATLYEKVIQNYFDALINPVFKNAVTALPIDQVINPLSKEVEDEEQPKWYDQLRSKREITFITDNGETITAPMPLEKELNQFSFAIIKVPEKLRTKALKGRDKFMESYNSTTPHYRVKILVNGEELFANYTEIDDAFEFNNYKGILKSSNEPREGLIGEIAVDFETDDGYMIRRYVDTRMDTFLSLMFHGIVAQKEYNDFEASNLIYAEDALFKHGIFIDAKAAPRSGNVNNYAALAKNNKALFNVNALPGGPILSFKFKKEESSRRVIRNEEPLNETPESAPIVELLNSILGTNLDPNKPITRGKLENIVNKSNEDIYKSTLKFDPSKVLFIEGPEGESFEGIQLVSLIDKFGEQYKGLNNTEAKKVKNKDKEIEFTTDVDGNEVTYIIKKTHNDFSIEYKAKTTATTLSEFVLSLKSSLLTHSLIKDDVDYTPFILEFLDSTYKPNKRVKQTRPIPLTMDGINNIKDKARDYFESSSSIADLAIDINDIYNIFSNLVDENIPCNLT